MCFEVKKKYFGFERILSTIQIYKTICTHILYLIPLVKKMVLNKTTFRESK